MNTEKMRWARHLDFAMLSGWLLMSLTLVIISFVWYGVDFRGYYAATRVLLAGGNPYDYHQVAPILQDVTGEMGNNPYYYPPWFTWIFLPIAALPFQLARAIWMTFNLVVWNIGLWQLGELIDWPQKGWRRYALFAMVTFSFAWITWRYEQAGILVFAMLVAMIMSIRDHKWILSGIWMALLLIKPNITLGVVVGIGLWLIYKHQWRAVLTTMITVVVLLLISTWITPDWFQPFLENGFGQGLTLVLDGPDKIVAFRINSTFLDWLSISGLESRIRYPIYGVGIFVGVIAFFWVVRHSQSILQLTSVLLLISYALTPYALQYDYSPLAIVLFWALSLCTSSTKAMSVGLFLSGFIFSVIFWQQNIAWAYWMVIGLIALTIWGSYHEGKNVSIQ